MTEVTTLNMKLGDKLHVNVLPETKDGAPGAIDGTPSYSVSDPNDAILDIDGNGLGFTVTALAAGTTTVTATVHKKSDPSQTVSADLTVIIAAPPPPPTPDAEKIVFALDDTPAPQ